MNYTLREARLSDIPTINLLAEKIWEPTYREVLTKEQIDYMFEVIYTPEALQQQMQEGQTFLLLFEDEQAIGFAAFSVKDLQEKVYKLNKIYLLPNKQGKGFGKLMITSVEEKVKALGAAVLDLNVNRYNKAKQFYENCGYQEHMQEDIPIGPYWMNDYVMRKVL
ncbi:GNAT family N-acetyltransferase [Pontibacter silvestris]|uniref:GNAT family N-acetyltransferase n=1 Tax=Pontibacter silvestris TaxID=2305183 RepID=A0ABW4WTR7_9BACT|nr:GNAT family N-acetyltransferase [Pontibacter silvestris]MCC9138188.1 GNAT family N-acetyltransferase [Pontibacter silvestris]